MDQLDRSWMIEQILVVKAKYSRQYLENLSDQDLEELYFDIFR